MPTIFPNTSNKNFEIALLSNIIQRSGNYVFEDDNPLTALMARVISYAKDADKIYAPDYIFEDDTPSSLHKPCIFPKCIWFKFEDDHLLSQKLQKQLIWLEI